MQFLPTRRRRSPAAAVSQAIQTVREALTDAAIAGLYVRGRNQAVSGGLLDSWGDARGLTAYGPTLAGTLTARPSVDGSGVATFDGVNDHIRASGLGLPSANGLAIAVVGTFPTVNNTYIADIVSAGAAARALALWRTTQLAATAGATTAGTAIPVAGTRVFHARRSGTGAVTVGVRNASAAEITAAAAIADAIADTVTIGASSAPAASAFGVVSVAAILIVSGPYGASQVAAVNAFAQSLGATV